MKLSQAVMTDILYKNHFQPPALHSLQHHEVGFLPNNPSWPLNPHEAGTPRYNSAPCWQQSAELWHRLCPGTTGWHQCRSPGGLGFMTLVMNDFRKHSRSVMLQEILHWPATPPQLCVPSGKQHEGMSCRRKPSGGHQLRSPSPDTRPHAGDPPGRPDTVE